jgi:hypothetical protein
MGRVSACINGKHIPHDMPLSSAAQSALSDAKSRVMFCVDLENHEQSVYITNLAAAK